MQAYHHAPDVHVEMGGVATADDDDEHIGAMKGILVDNPEARILQHYPQVAQGEWTAVVGHYVPGELPPLHLCPPPRGADRGGVPPHARADEGGARPVRG
ncbi:hypothetical protein [Streptomyces griseoruber]|uniref:hypothetical protein n=1 Tax=Streptomyces griseoruber TaxID=1943 RepID=UPI00378EF462